MSSDPCAPVALVVEDEWLVRAEIAIALQGAGWSALEASTGEGALTLLQTGQPIDILITDILLAGDLSGWDVAEAFRTAHPEIPVIYASGNAVTRSRQVPGSVFFDKPYEPAKVLQACSELVHPGSRGTRHV